LNLPLLVGVREPGPSRGLTRVSAPLRKRNDAAGSAVNNAAENAGKNGPPALSSSLDEQTGEKENRLALLLFSQPDQPRLFKPRLLTADRRRRATCLVTSVLAQVVGASGGALGPKSAPSISQPADSSLTVRHGAFGGGDSRGGVIRVHPYNRIGRERVLHAGVCPT
jgi:hypothetical protein